MFSNVFADERPLVFFTSLNRMKQKQWHSLGHTRFCLRPHGYVTDQIISSFSPSSPVTIHASLHLIPHIFHLFSFFLFHVAAYFSPILVSYSYWYSSGWCYVYPYPCILLFFRMYTFNSLTTNRITYAFACMHVLNLVLDDGRHCRDLVLKNIFWAFVTIVMYLTVQPEPRWTRSDVRCVTCSSLHTDVSLVSLRLAPLL